MTDSFPLFGQRQKALLATAIFILGFGCAYFVVARPLQAKYRAYQAEIPAQQELLAWMEKSARMVQASAAQRPRPLAGELPQATIAAVVKELQLEKSLKRIEPVAEKEVRLTFEEAGFDTLLALLARLHEREGLAATEVAIERGREPGGVNAVLTFGGRL